VATVRASKRDVTVQIEATGTVSALSTVDVKPQISSVVTGVHVQEGQFVSKGQLLFTLDDRADRANLAKAEAQVLRDQATLADAQRQLARSQDLLEKNFISQGAVDTNQAQADAQRAALASDRAAADAARVAVSYARILAPSAGRVGQIQVFAGSSVSPTGSPMVTITQLDPIAVSFNLPQRNLGDALQALSAPAAKALPRPAAAADAPMAPGRVRALLPEGRGTREGQLRFVDNIVDAASGTVKVKALFDNRDQALWPGAYVNVQLALGSLPGAVVVPQAAIVQGARGTAVFVADGNLAQIRPVTVLQSLGLEAAVSGVHPGDRVIVEGRQNVRPGSVLIERAPEQRAGGGRAASGARPASAALPGASSGLARTAP
jgi:RND family efflux transporter MFP subunit